MKKILFFFCACAMVVVMSSCGGGADTSTPQGVMEAYFKCAQKGDIDGIVELMDLKDDTQKDTYKGLLKLGEEEMKVVVDADSRITEISKTCRPEDAMGESVGIEKITADYSEALARELDQMILQEGLIDIFYERAFERLIPQGHTFKVVDTTHYFSYELDTPEDFQRAQELMPKELL
jgi:choline kinase